MIFYQVSLNPFRAGRCLSTFQALVKFLDELVSIPFEQGDVFRLIFSKSLANSLSQSLSSRAMSFDSVVRELFETAKKVSIPFEQGDVFRQKFSSQWNEEEQSQSLSSRAMSFDLFTVAHVTTHASQSLSSRAMSFDLLRGIK